jgi:RimJ/RimL family protein N-acetyltransferase
MVAGDERPRAAFWVDAGLGPELRFRTLTVADAQLLVEATRAEVGRALWGAWPAGPYTVAQARDALRGWDPAGGSQVSFGLVRAGTLVAAFGLMRDGRHSAELAYWVPPACRRQGLATVGLRFLTRWGHDQAGLERVWLEINPENEPSLGVARRAGFRYERRLPRHCRCYTVEDPRQDTWHDCLIWVHTAGRDGDSLRPAR